MLRNTQFWAGNEVNGEWLPHSHRQQFIFQTIIQTILIINIICTVINLFIRNDIFPFLWKKAPYCFTLHFIPKLGHFQNMAETRGLKGAYAFPETFLKQVERICLKFHQAFEFVYLEVLLQHLQLFVCRPVRAQNLKQCQRLTLAPETWAVEVLVFFSTCLFSSFFLTSTHYVSLQISHQSLGPPTLKCTVRYVCGSWLTPSCLSSNYAGRPLTLRKVGCWKHLF